MYNWHIQFEKQYFYSVSFLLIVHRFVNGMITNKRQTSNQPALYEKWEMNRVYVVYINLKITNWREREKEKTTGWKKKGMKWNEKDRRENIQN